MKRFLAICACLIGVQAGAQTEKVPERGVQASSATATSSGQQPTTRQLRYRFAQKAFRAGRHDLAKRQLRHLMRTSQSTADLRLLQNGYASVLAKSRWSHKLSFAILPSTNIDKTSSNELFVTPLGVFRIAGGGIEESGVGLRFGGQINYETPFVSGTTLTYGLALNRTQYPTKRLNHFDGTLSVDWAMFAVGSRSQITPYVSRYVYDRTEGESPSSNRYGLRFFHERYLGKTASIAGFFTAEYRDFDAKDFLDGSFLRASMLYQTRLASGVRLRAQAGLSASRPNQDHLRYVGQSLFAEMSRSVGDWGVGGLNVALSNRDYGADFPSFGAPRADHSARLGISFRPNHIRVMDSTPKLSCGVQNNWSNIALYDFRSTDCAISFEKSF